MVVRISPTSRGARLARGAMLSGTSAALATAAHAVAGGAAPGTGAAVVCTVLFAGAGTALAGRQRGPGAMLAALAVSQLALHELLDSLGGHHPAPHPAALAMTAGHALAVAATAVLLAKADAAIFALATALGMLLPSRCAPAAVCVEPDTVVPPAPLANTALDLLLRNVIAGRAPPAARVSRQPTHPSTPGSRCSCTDLSPVPGSPAARPCSSP